MLVKIRDVFRKYKILSLWLVAFLVAAVFAVIGIIGVTQQKKETIEVEATVVEVKTEVDEFDDTTSYSVYVDYVDEDGVNHVHILWPKNTDKYKVGDVITVKYDVANPGDLVEDSKVVSLIFAIVGVALAVVSVVVIVITIKKKSLNEYNKVDMSQASQEQIEEIKNNNEPVHTYYFKHTGKLNQSYILEDEESTPRMEARCDKIGVLSKYQFTFVNHINGRNTPHEVTHVTKVEHDDMITSSNFKIDGMNCWEFIGKKGYSLDPSITFSDLTYKVYHYGINVGEISLAMLKSTIKEAPKNSVFKVDCKESDLEQFFYICFVMERTKSA